MNGMHDMGGRQGMGPIDIDPGQPTFRAEWERRVFGLSVLAFAGGHFNLDQFRYVIESMPPTEYLESDYYGRWFYALERLCATNGSINEDEVNVRIQQLAKGAV